MKFVLTSLKLKNSLIMIAVMVPLIVGFLAFDLNRQTGTMRKAITERGIILALTGAEMTGKILTDALDKGQLTEEQLFDTNYQPIPNTTPQKYHTAYDAYTDEHLKHIQDAYLKDKIIVYAVALDQNGYIPTHNTLSKIGYGENSIRSKRIFNDPVGLAAVQNQELYLFQEYRRDTGELIWDISSPIYVNGRHWGGFRVGFSIEDTYAQIASLRNQVAAGGVVLIVVMILLILYISGLITDPVKRLEQVAKRVAQGDLTGMDVCELKMSRDEVGSLTRTFCNMMEKLRELVEKSLSTASVVASYTRELQNSIKKAVDNSCQAAARMSGLAEAMKKMEEGAKAVVGASDKTMNSLAAAEAASANFLEQMETSSAVVTRAGESVKELESYVDKVGEILLFISLIADQASLLAQKAVEEAAVNNARGDKFSSLAGEIQNRARDAAAATRGITSLFEKARKHAAQATVTLEKDREVVLEGYNTAREASQSLSDIISDLKELINSVNEVTTYTQLVTEGIAGVNTAAGEQTELIKGFTEAARLLEQGIGEMQETLTTLKI
ncbi:MAG: Methyl-accepting chemotaxis protein PctB [Firmicutes bacterium ADurb.Bin456]|nr:MAG: Methyl-accepting chemotaxis protein PctB [Firmicutes bacterium ADurb.Bin456]